MRLRFRTARPDDVREVASLHVASWRDAYRGILDDDFLDGALPDFAARQWEAVLAQPQRSATVVLAMLGTDSAGFVAILRKGAVAYVDSLHVRPGMRGAGIGRALLAFAARRMRHRGCASAELVVFAANPGAIRFYTALGASIGPEEPSPSFGPGVPQHRCTWPDIGALISACGLPER